MPLGQRPWAVRCHARDHGRLRMPRRSQQRPKAANGQQKQRVGPARCPTARSPSPPPAAGSRPRPSHRQAPSQWGRRLAVTKERAPQVLRPIDRLQPSRQRDPSHTRDVRTHWQTRPPCHARYAPPPHSWQKASRTPKPILSKHVLSPSQVGSLRRATVCTFIPAVTRL